MTDTTAQKEAKVVIDGINRSPKTSMIVKLVLRDEVENNQQLSDEVEKKSTAERRSNRVLTWASRL